MSASNDGGPAFSWRPPMYRLQDGKPTEIIHDGMTYRAWAAGRAMQGILSNDIAGMHRVPAQVALDAVNHADALIEALKK
jgi:hypothetical protein